MNRTGQMSGIRLGGPGPRAEISRLVIEGRGRVAPLSKTAAWKPTNARESTCPTV